MINNRDNSPAAQILLSDLVENILKYSDNPGACAEYVTTQIRELIGVRMVALVSDEAGKGHNLVGICPPRMEEYWNHQPELQQFITGALAYEAPRFINPKTDPAGKALSSIGIGTSFVIPLMVGAERVGMLVLLDLLDQRGASIILETLASASRILALILKNSLLYRDLEQKVAERTEELQAANAQLQRELAERKQAEASLRQSETLLNATQRLAKIGGWDWDGEQQTSFWTEETYRIHGFDPQEFAPGTSERIDRSLMCYDPADRPVISAAFQHCVQQGDGYDLDLPFTSSDGCRKWIRTTAAAVREAGRIIKVVGNIMDITERKATEEALRQLNTELDQRVLERTAELEAANKEMHAFTYTVSHDLRAPLRHIDGFMGLLQKKVGTALDEQGRHYMDTISKAAKKMGLLIDDLLSFSRMGRHAISFQPVELGTLVREVIRELEPDAAGRHIEWRIGDLPAVGGDAAMLRMVLSNLISNALKFTRPRQQAEIEIGSMPGRPSETVIFVRDNGVGFDMTYVDKLFGVFQRLHRADEFEGTGIGLANVRRVIARHGGRTWAQGQPDLGAAFFFSLPLTNKE